MYFQRPISTATPIYPSTSIGKWIVRSFIAVVVVSAIAVGAGLLYSRSQALIESVYPNVTSEQIAEVEKLTGITFPKGTVWLGYEYDHWSCIDPSMIAKVRIPSRQLNEFRTNKLLVTPADQTDVTDYKTYPSWWSPNKVSKVADGEYHKDEAFVRWTLGNQNDEHLFYIHWAIF